MLVDRDGILGRHNHRELLPQQKRGDPYQYLKVDLEGLYE